MTTELTTTDFQQLDKLDEQQIVAELQGALLDQYVYSFKSGGREVVGLSWAGVKAVANKLGAVACDLLELRESDDAYICVMKAAAPDGTTRIGAAEQSKMMKTRSGEKSDPFALPKAVSKAQRNAIRALLPESLITEVVKMHQQQRKPASNGSANWTRDATTISKLMKAANERLGLSQADVHLALLVDDIRDFNGSKPEAWKMLQRAAETEA